MKNSFSDFTGLDAMKNHPVSGQIDDIFKNVIKENKTMSTKSTAAVASAEEGLSLADDGELEINLGGDEAPPESEAQDEGMELDLAGEELDLGEDDYTGNEEGDGEQYGDLSLDSDEEEMALLEEETEEGSDNPENLGELSFDQEEMPEAPVEEAEDDGPSLFDLGIEGSGESLDLGAEESLDLGSEEPLDLGGEESLDLGSDESFSLGGDEELNLSDDDSLSLDESDLSDDAKEKLKEIDAIMEFDASQVHIRPTAALNESLDEVEDLDQPLVSEDLDLGSINFGAEEEEAEEEEVIIAPPKEEKQKKKKKEPAPVVQARDRDLGEDLKQISGAYSGEMERMQATISNLRADREELLNKIQKLEDDKVIQSRQGLTVRAELDERKIELMIIRKKLNEEINDLKDRQKLYDEKRLILEEKNRILMQELDKAAQKNKIDVKKVLMREKELEQKLELLKSDAETQIRNRDLKILELKRKIDAMEFDMESISQQEKRSVESRYELEDKLEKAIKTLRSAITVLEDETDRSNALNALKKNIDM